MVSTRSFWDILLRWLSKFSHFTLIEKTLLNLDRMFRIVCHFIDWNFTIDPCNILGENIVGKSIISFPILGATFHIRDNSILGEFYQ